MALRDQRGNTPPDPPDVPGAPHPKAKEPKVASAPKTLKAPKAPTSRPAWLVLLSSLTMLYGGFLLISSLDTLRDPQAAARVPLTHALTPPEEALAKQLADVNAHVVGLHQRTLLGHAVAALPVALVMLFAAASTLSRDRNGRGVTLAAAWLGIAYQVGTLWVTFPIVRDYARLGAPLLAQLVTVQTDGAVSGGVIANGQRATPEAVTKLLMGVPVVTTILGIAGSLVLIRYFGGRRGRVLYGLEQAGSKS
jgi:hypothetical protein